MESGRRLATCRATRPTISLRARWPIAARSCGVDQPGPFHNVVDLAFNTSVGPGDADYGMLYITSGDGGNSATQAHDADRGRQNLARSTATFCASIRTRPPTPWSATNANSGLPAYSIPADNPFNGDDAMETKDLVDAGGDLGPWLPQSMAADVSTAAHGDLYLGDVGENLWEEVDLIEKGKNYGWGADGRHS